MATSYYNIYMLHIFTFFYNEMHLNDICIEYRISFFPWKVIYLVIRPAFHGILQMKT